MYTYIPSLLLAPSPIPTLQVITEHRAEPRAPFHRFLLAVSHVAAHMSVLISQLIPPSPTHTVSMHLFLYVCVSIPALELGSSVLFFLTPVIHSCLSLLSLCVFFFSPHCQLLRVQVQRLFNIALTIQWLEVSLSMQNRSVRQTGCSVSSHLRTIVREGRNATNGNQHPLSGCLYPAGKQQNQTEQLDFVHRGLEKTLLRLGIHRQSDKATNRKGFTRGYCCHCPEKSLSTLAVGLWLKCWHILFVFPKMVSSRVRKKMCV